MKKILLASTALVGFAGAAAAEVTLDGYAEMGIRGGNAIETQFHSDWQVNFNFSSTTDGGVEFGGKVQIEDSNGASRVNGPVVADDEAFWMSGSFGKVTLGETDGAFDWALGEIDGGGSAIADDHTTHLGAYWFTGLDATYDNQIARYEYSFGDFAAAFSMEMDDAPAGGDPVLGLGAKWSGSMGGADVSAGIGYQDNGVNSVWGLSGAATMANGVTVSLGYADLDNTAFHTSNGFTTTPLVESWWGLGVAYRTGALSLGVNYGVFDSDIGDLSGWGLGVNYDLGGGAVVMAGYGSSSAPAGSGGGSWNGGGDDTWSIGVGMSF